ncbi:hypothetical protein FQN54_005473 [Arachnomyces sp. PD_36]|nr:hypothetical protein FQN54_005473 [Arachnomyces sp. PD_36]
MAATLSGTYTSAPDTPSPIYPDRLIRPLPRNPIRARLSQEMADSILYPPAPPVTQLFYGYPENVEVVNDAKVYVQQDMDGYGYEETAGHHCDDEGDDSAGEDGPVVVRRSARFRRPSLNRSASGRARQYVNNLDGNHTKSGPDGYDAFENTNNKKKRKIPTSGNAGTHNSSLSTDLANMGLSCSTPSGSVDDGSGTGPYHGTGTPASPVGNGISGPGRGRYGRNAGRNTTGRTPLDVLAPNLWPGGRTVADRRDTAHSLSQDQAAEPDNKTDQGIISAAIANAAALSSTIPRGQENVSLLDQQPKKASPTKTQFTFTCESDSSKGMAWQTHNPYPIPQNRPTHVLTPPSALSQRFATQGTQTSPNMASQANQQVQQPPPPQHQQQGGQPNTQGRKSRRPQGNIYALAARQRKIQQQYANLHHPPNVEDIWICEFCEYESIFGHRPEALIRQYEIKDRKERRRLAEKRRLLEKAKMKGRKGKKATKNAAKNAAAQQHPPQQGYDRQHTDHGPMDGHGDPDDDYLGEEYDDDPTPVPAPAPHQQQPAHRHPPPPNNNNHMKSGIGTGTAAKGMVGGQGVGQAAGQAA